MSWENIEQRLAQLFSEEISFPAGRIWFPPRYFSIEEWLTHVAETDEERNVIATTGIDFLRYRWPFEILVELIWDDNGATNQGDFKLETMYVGKRAYILLFQPAQHQVVAAVEPANEPELFRAVIRELFSNSDVIAELPSRIVSCRPDLISQNMVEEVFQRRVSEPNQIDAGALGRKQ
jgi:hypothetical protein